jgi:hypothetical protein
MRPMRLAASGITQKTAERHAYIVRNEHRRLKYELANKRAVSADTEALVRRSAVSGTSTFETATSNRSCRIVRLFRFPLRSWYILTFSMLCSICILSTRSFIGNSNVRLRPKEVQAFLESYAQHFNITSRFQLNTEVTSVSRIGDKWHLTLTRKSGDQEEQAFDRLVVCTGLFQTPRAPHVEGLDEFEGRILNTQTYKKS